MTTHGEQSQQNPLERIVGRVMGGSTAEGISSPKS